MRDDRRTGVLDPLEAASDHERRAHHDDVLRRAVRLAWDGVPFYRRKLEEAGVAPDDVKTLGDLARIPITTKPEAREVMAGTGTIALHEARRIYVSPGPHFYASHRRSDPPPQRGATPLALAFHAMGFRENDIVLNTFTYHLVPAGVAIEEQLNTAGCAVIPAGPHNTEAQAEILAELPVAGYAGTPTFLRLLCEKAAATGKDPRRDWRLEVAFVTAERLPEPLRAELEERTGAVVRQIYGSADGLLPAYECWAARGMHLHPDQVIEVLDPETHDPAPVGSPGMVVATVAAGNRPLVRFANLDLVALRDDPCPCGRTGPRIDRFVGRLDEATKVRGMFVYPDQIAQVIARYPEVARWQAVVARDTRAMDDLVVRVERAHPGDEAFETRLAGEIGSLIRLRARIEDVAPGTIPPDAARIVDERGGA